MLQISVGIFVCTAVSLTDASGRNWTSTSTSYKGDECCIQNACRRVWGIRDRQERWKLRGLRFRSGLQGSLAVPPAFSVDLTPEAKTKAGYMLLQQLLSLPSATFISKPLGGLQLHINNAGKISILQCVESQMLKTSKKMLLSSICEYWCLRTKWIRFSRFLSYEFSGKRILSTDFIF